MASSSPLRIAVIGAGSIGPRHAKSVASNPSCALTALVEPSSSGPSIAASLHTTHYPSLASLLSVEHKPDAAIVCTPNHTHVPLSLDLVEAGVHVLVEKPISTTVEEGRELVKRAREKSVKLLVGHHRRFNPYLLSAKKCLESRSLGKIIAVQGTWCALKPKSYFESHGSWHQEAGTVMINLIHEVDLLQYLLGPIVLVSALETPKTRGYEAEEGATIIMRFESGVVGTFLLSDAVPSPWNFEAGTGENPTIPKIDGAEGFYRIMGTEGSLSVPDLKKWGYAGERSWNEVLKNEELGVQKEKVPFDLQVQHFVDVVRNGEEPSCTGEEALRALVACEAIKRAMKTGMPVEIRGFEIVGKTSA